MSGRRSHPVVAEYSRLAAGYDRRWSHYISASTRETVARFALEPGARVLDVGCGTGFLLATLASTYPDAELLGIDPVPGMIRVARRRLPPAVGLGEAWAEALPFADRTFDAVVSCSALHYMRRPQAALEEAARILRPGGEIVITDWCGDFLFGRLIDRYLSRFNAAHHRVYRSGDLVRMMREAGYLDPRPALYRVGAWGLMTVTARKDAETD